MAVSGDVGRGAGLDLSALAQMVVGNRKMSGSSLITKEFSSQVVLLLKTF